MKKNRLKIFALGILTIFILLGGLFYYASTKLRSDEIKKLAIEQTQKMFPKAEVNLDSVDIGWGLNFKISLVNFSIRDIKDNQKYPMMSVNQIVLKVPVWAVLTGAGLIEVKLDAPEVNYHEFLEGNNWSHAIGNSKSISDQKNETTSSSSESSTASLGIFRKSKINIKLSDISVKYNLKDNSKGEVKVSRFLVKGLNFESSTAFEIASTAKFSMKDQSIFSFDTMAIGEFNASDLIKNGSISSVVIIKINNISKTGLAWKIPEITTKLDMVLRKDGEISGGVTTTFENQNKVTAHFKMSKKMEVTDINAEIILKDIASIMNLDNTIDMSKAKFFSKGSILYGEDKKISANLNFNITPGISYSKDGFSAVTTIVGEFKEKDLSLKVKTESLEGQINTFITGVIDPNEKFEMGKLKPFDIRVIANGMKIPEKFIRAKLWDKKKEEEKIVVEKDSRAKANSQLPDESMGLPPSSISFEWSNVNIGGEDFSGRGKMITSTNAVAIDNLTFKFSKGSGKLTQTMRIGKNASESKFNFEIANLNLSSFKAFLPPFVENFSGTFSGKVAGAATIYNSTKAPVFDVQVAIDAKKGEVKKLNLSDYINPMLANIPIVKDQVKDRQIKVDGNFETLSMKGQFNNDQYTLSSFDFVGIDKKIQVSGSGEIYPQVGSKNSVVEFNVIDNTGKISDLLQKNMGTKILPMRITGPGFDLKPDYAFTISRLAKGALKTKAEDKLKEVVKKNLDKIVPAAAKEKVKNLLDGFLKRK